MANLKVKDATGATVEVKATGSGSTGDPFIPDHGLTDTQLRASAVPVSGTVGVSGAVAVTGPLTDTQLRAVAVPVSGTVGVSGSVAVTGPVTDTQLRATPVPVSGTVAVTGPLTDTQLRAVAVPVSGTVGVSGSVAVTGPVTDTQLRATPVPVSGTVAVTGPLTDAQLRATPVPVTGSFSATTYTSTTASGTLTRPANATAYTAGALVASSTTAGSVVVPVVTVARIAAGSGLIRSALLKSNHLSGLDAINFTVDLWSAAPTFTNGDGGAYAVATNGDKWLGSMSGTFRQFADQAVAMCAADGGFPEIAFKLASGTDIYWTLRTNAAFTPASGKTFTLVPSVLPD